MLRRDLRGREKGQRDKEREKSKRGKKQRKETWEGDSCPEPMPRLGMMVLAVFTSLQGTVSIFVDKEALYEGPGHKSEVLADQVLEPRAV